MLGCTPLLRSEQIRLIDEQQTSPLSLPSSSFSFSSLDILHVCLKIFASETERIACVHNLYNEMRTLQDTP